MMSGNSGGLTKALSSVVGILLSGVVISKLVSFYSAHKDIIVLISMMIV